jgi:hypothetical protein
VIVSVSVLVFMYMLYAALSFYLFWLCLFFFAVWELVIKGIYIMASRSVAVYSRAGWLPGLWL